MRIWRESRAWPAITARFLGVSMPLLAGLKVGDVVPAFRAVDQDGNEWRSEPYLGKKVLVL